MLLKLGLLVEGPDGTLAAAEARVATPPEVSRLAVGSYYVGVAAYPIPCCRR